MIRTTAYLKPAMCWGVLSLAGVVWGAGLSRTLAHDLALPVFYQAPGVILCILICVLGTVLTVLYSKRKGSHLSELTQQFLPLYLPVVDILTAGYNPWRGTVLLLVSLMLVLLLSLKFVRAAVLGFAILIPLFVYLPDISPYVGRADTFEFQVVAPRLGIAHPSGYPLYVLIGKLFSLLPFGTIAWRVNLSSSVLAILTCAMLYLTLTEGVLSVTDTEVGKNQKIGSLLCALTLAFSPTLWSRAIEAEVYTLNALMVVLDLWITGRWLKGRFTAKVALPLLGCLTGLAIASHLTLGALTGIVIAVMVYKHRDINWQTLFWCLALGLAGFSLYLYIPLRWPAVTAGETMSLQQFWHYVTNAESGGALLPRAFIDDPTRWGLVFRLMQQQVSWVGLVFAVIGLIVLFTHQWSMALGTFLSFTAWVWFCLSFYVAEPDYSAFLVPGHVVMIFWLGIGVLATLNMLQRYAPWAISIALVLCALLPASRLWLTGPTLDTIALGYTDEMWGRYVFKLPIPREAVIMADSEKFPPLYYLQQIEGIRTDVTLVTLFDERQYRNALETYLSAGKVVFLARYLPGLDEFGVSSLGPLVRVSPEEQNQGSLYTVFGDALVLRDFILEQDPEGRPMHHLTLSWLAIDDVSEDLEVRLRLTTLKDNHTAWISESARPIGGYSSTAAWVKGTTLKDYHLLSWPGWLPSATYHLEMGLFPRFSDTGLSVNAGSETWVRLLTQEFGTTDPRLPPVGHLRIPTPVLFDEDLWLMDIEVFQEVLPASPTMVDVTWRCRNLLPEAIVPLFSWVTDDNSTVISFPFYEQSTGESVIGNLICNGQSIIRRYIVDTPADPADYSLVLALLYSKHDVATARCHWLGRVDLWCPVAQVTVIPTNLGAANYGNTILLLNAAIDVEGLSAGGPLSVMLNWRGLRSMEKDYTIFLQIVGPDGVLYGQVDSWPQQGGRPTSGWSVGEDVSDHYSVYLQENAPPGQYSVILGWYLLADMHRIPVVTDTGQIINDYYLIGTFTLSSDGSVE